MVGNIRNMRTNWISRLRVLLEQLHNAQVVVSYPSDCDEDLRRMCSELHAIRARYSDRA